MLRFVWLLYTRCFVRSCELLRARSVDASEPALPLARLLTGAVTSRSAGFRWPRERENPNDAFECRRMGSREQAKMATR
jgi:hypothetical protein